MDDMVFVQVAKRGQQARPHRDHILNREGAAPDPFGKRPPFQEWKHDMHVVLIRDQLEGRVVI